MYSIWIQRACKSIKNLSNMLMRNSRICIFQIRILLQVSLWHWKGHPSFKQYISLKAAKFDIKLHDLCESSIGYIRSFFIYTGQPVYQFQNKTAARVVKLTEQLLHYCYTLWMDNFCNSPQLARSWKQEE